MATDQQTRPASAATASAKFEAFVDQQLTRVKQRLRAIDLGAAGLLLLAITLGYAALMAVFDLAVRGSSEAWVGTVRLLAFGGYLLAMAAGGYVLVARLLRRINPYYCAHQLEQTLPDAKNSVINWLDLKEERLPPAIRSSLGMRAAKDLKDADADRVVDPKQSWFMGGLAAAMFVILVIVFALSPNQFGSLLARAFVPFRDISLANRATITLIKPAGNVDVPHNQPVQFLAQIDGRFPKVNHPQAPTLWYRYAPGDPFQPVPLEEDGNGQWAATMAADQVQNGFWYKITAADDATEIYQVSTRSRPEAKQFEVTYHYRPYRKLADETVIFPNEHAVFPELRGHRGTDVTLVVRANQPVRDGGLQLEFADGPKQVHGEPLADDPKAFRCKFALERSCQYRVLFKTPSQEINTDRAAYRIEVLDDLTPAVVITKPAQDVSLPANGTLTVTGHAQDDFGVKAVALRLRVFESKQGKPNLAGQPYRPGKKFQFDTGHYPTKLDYLDVLALDQLKTEDGAAFAPAPGTILEYWLEATDNSDYPSAAGNVGRSPAFKIKIEPPQDPKKQKDERQQAQDQQKKHDKQQDQQHQKENDQKNDEEANKNSGKSPEQRQAEKLKNEREDIENKIKEALKQEEQKKNQGEAKGKEPPKADNKGDGGQQPPEANQKDSKSAGKEPQQAGDKKDDGKKDDGKKNDGKKNDGPKSAEAKGPGDQKQPQNAPEKQQASEPKGPGNEKPQPSAKGQDANNKGENQPDQQPASAKAGPKDDAKQPAGQSKDDGQAAGQTGKVQDKNAQAKDNSPKDDKMKQGPEAKSAQGSKDAPSPQAKNDTKGPEKKGPDNQAGKKGETKPGKNEQLTKEKGQGNTKPDATASKNPPGADGTRQPAEAKPGEQAARKSEAKDGGGQGMEETKQGPPAQAKNQPMNPNGKPQPGAKETPADEAKEAATAKDEKGQAPPREPTMKDLERLKDQLAKGDPQALKTAEELKRNLPENKDPKLGKAAEEILKEGAKALDEMAKQEAKANPNTAGGGPEQPLTKTETPMNAKGGGDEQNPMPPKGQAPQKTKSGNDQATTAKNTGGSGPGAENAPDHLKPTAADKDFADRLANLQLEEFKDRVTPETLKRAGVSDEAWERYLKSAEAYERLRAKLQNQPKSEPDKLRAKPGQFVDTGPRAVSNPAATTNPASIGRALPPFELREAQRRFTKQKTQ
ncbi:MAG: hypothetical protein L0Y71_21370 [Gemmataceae bacterium]|nr:hypothetical protein [Gemmataceae bacterium]